MNIFTDYKIKLKDSEKEKLVFYTILNRIKKKGLTITN